MITKPAVTTETALRVPGFRQDVTLLRGANSTHAYARAKIAGSTYFISLNFLPTDRDASSPDTAPFYERILDRRIDTLTGKPVRSKARDKLQELADAASRAVITYLVENAKCPKTNPPS